MTKKDIIKLRIAQIEARMDEYICDQRKRNRYPMIAKLGKQLDDLKAELKQYEQEQKGIS